MSNIQVFVSYKKEIPDTAALTAFDDGGDNFVASASSKFSPFTGKPTTTIGEQSLVAKKSDIAEIITIGKCKCGSIHRADIASVSGMLDENTTNFFCIDCGAAVPLDVKMSEYLAASADESADENNEPENSETPPAVNDDTTDTVEESGTDADDNSSGDEGDESSEDADVIDDTVDDGTSDADEDANADADADVIDDTAEDDTNNTEGDNPVKDDADAESDTSALLDEADFDAVLAKLVQKASLDIGASFEELTVDEASDIDESVETTDAPNDTAEPNSETVNVGKEPNVDTREALTPPAEESATDAAIDSANSLFTGKNENPEGKSLAEIIENPEGVENPPDGAHLVALDKNVNLKMADIAFVLNSKKSAYLVFADDKPIGTLSRARAHADNAKLFEDEVFTRAFSSQLVSGMDVSRFGYAPYVVRVNTKAIRKAFTEKQIADTAKVVSQKFDTRLDAIKTSLATVALAANKGVWADYKNPLRDALVAKLTAIGVEDSAAIVGKIFVDASGEYIENLLSKAIDLADKPVAIQQEFKRSVDTANYIVAPSNGASLGARLASLGTPTEESFVPVNKPRLVCSDTAAVNPPVAFDWKHAFRP